MAKSMTEDEVRDLARGILGFSDKDGVRSGVGQLTTFNKLGFAGVADKPDGWYLPNNHADVAVVLETKASSVPLGEKQVEEILKNISIIESQYRKVVGILYNGDDIRVFMNHDEVETVKSLQKVEYYTALFNSDTIDKEHIYELTAKINNCLHFSFGIKNLYHRMIFTACALVAKRYNALMVSGMDYSMFHNAILNCLNKELVHDKQQNHKLGILTDVFARIEMNLDVSSEEEKSQEHVKKLITDFIGWVTEISDCLNSDAWRGEDVMGIFFNEFNRYKKKSEAGQVFTPEHITDFMYKILDVNKDDRVLDGCCGSGGFLVKAMANMIQEAGGVQTQKAIDIKREQLYGIEFDKEIYALACANMLIHKDGKTNLEQLDARSVEAGKWISSKRITKVLMNPPYENKYGCITIVENMLDNVPAHTMCGFILPDKKLEKVSKTQIKRILKNHRLTKIIKLPEDLFFGIGVTTSIFVFESGVPQGENEIFGCYIETDGLETVKNKGRHDVRGRWPSIERYWVESIKKLRDDKHGTAQWIKPSAHLSYQMPERPFVLFEEDFRKTAMDYFMFMKGIDVKEFSDKLLAAAMYSSDIQTDNGVVRISIKLESLIQADKSKTIVETVGWRNFQVGELFKEIVKPPVLHSKEVEEAEDGIPYVVRTKFNNGIKCRVKRAEGFIPSPAGVISFGAENATFFYQEEEFYSGRDIYYIDVRNLSKNAALFLTACLQPIAQKYSYNFGMFPDLVKKDSIKLPVTSEGKPNWDYMDSYMNAILDRESTDIKQFGCFVG